MKCDELKAGVIKTPHDEGMTFNRGSDVIAVEERKTEFYLKSIVDEAIAELKEEIKKEQEIANEQTFKLCVEKENVWQLEELLQEKKKEIEDLKNSHYAEMTDLGMENFKLKQQLRKQKRKRCVAMARACHFMMAMRLFPNKEYVRKWAERGNKWIDLADKFKG